MVVVVGYRLRLAVRWGAACPAHGPCLGASSGVGVVHDLEISASGRARVRTGLCGENIRHPPCTQCQGAQYFSAVWSTGR